MDLRGPKHRSKLQFTPIRTSDSSPNNTDNSWSSTASGKKRKYLPNKCREYEVKEGREACAAEASNWLAEFLTLYPDDSFSLGVLIAGWDQESGPALYKVNGKGKRLKSSMAGTGCAAGVWAALTENPSYDIKNISLAEASELAKRTLCFGVYMAFEYGDSVSVFHVGRDGIEWVVREEDIVQIAEAMDIAF
ncbi:OLC1v1012367C1 [Oldenlandia corymbosa var. corymbosa]|uniref:OLC1v1012367C1 n=1 Tax=Oldenlandia corymbosa var. corymbosa TaxID=529605 RepID=A0AAV1DZ00_OLDCO|nr:OLC1v1012367C1 [Oldenlandia corymbosa var. corymbosa]